MGAVIAMCENIGINNGIFIEGKYCIIVNRVGLLKLQEHQYVTLPFSSY